MQVFPAEKFTRLPEALKLIEGRLRVDLRGHLAQIEGIFPLLSGEGGHVRTRCIVRALLEVGGDAVTQHGGRPRLQIDAAILFQMEKVVIDDQPVGKVAVETLQYIDDRLKATFPNHREVCRKYLLNCADYYHKWHQDDYKYLRFIFHFKLNSRLLSGVAFRRFRDSSSEEYVVVADNGEVGLLGDALVFTKPYYAALCGKEDFSELEHRVAVAAGPDGECLTLVVDFERR